MPKHYPAPATASVDPSPELAEHQAQVDQQLADTLRRAAALWLAQIPPTARQGTYSTLRNEFLWAAEAAYFDVVGHRLLVVPT